jgi:hypothetical protein
MACRDHAGIPSRHLRRERHPASPVSAIEAYAGRLRASAKQVETYFPDNGPHGFYFGLPSAIPETGEAAKRAVAFIRRYLT